MTETEWLECKDPQKMLEFTRCKVSERKLRLYACVCVSEYIRFMSPPHSDTGSLAAALELSERFAEGQVNRDEWWKGTRERFHFSPWKAVDAYSEAVNAIQTAAGVAGWHETRCFCKEQERDELKQLAAFLRCIVGNPFTPTRLDPARLVWNSGTVVKIAQAIYEERRFADIPVLADALEEVGCDNTEILDHCRGPGPHVRGCWVVDLLLAKK